MAKARTLLLAFGLIGLWCGAAGRSPAEAHTGKQQTPAPDFICPEEFGYFPHPDDCTQYYVCVFGGALLESCTGGLMYSHDLQTCDWPRNVNCGLQENGTGTFVYERTGPLVVESNRDRNYAIANSQSRSSDIIRTRQPQILQQQQQQQQQQLPQDSAQPALNDNSDLVGNVVSTSPRYSNIRFQDDNQADGSRLGRSYEQNVPNYKEEIYNAVGSGVRRRRSTTIVKRQTFSGPNPGHDNMYPSSYWRQRDLAFGTYADQHVHRFVKSPFVGRPHFSQNRYNNGHNNNPVSIRSRPHQQQQYQQQQQQLQQQAQQLHPYHNHHPHHHHHNSNRHNYHHHVNHQQRERPQEQLQQQQQQQQQQKQQQQQVYHHNHQQEQEEQEQDHHYESEESSHDSEPITYQVESGRDRSPLKAYNENHRLVVPRPSVPPTPTILPSLGSGRFRLRHKNHHRTTESPKVELFDGFQPSSFWPREQYDNNNESSSGSENDDDDDNGNGGHLTSSEPSNSPLTLDDMSVNGGGKTTPAISQQEIIIDPEYLAQRYAANVQPVANASANLYYDDSAYYIYDEEKEEPQYDDVDYKSNQQQVTPQKPQVIQQQQPLPVIVETTTTTRRPLPPPTTAAPKSTTRTSSRGSTRHKSSSGGNRPTLKPSANILKDVQEAVRDVYVDAPSRPPPVYETPVPNSPATKCRADECLLPDCFCGGKHIPGSLPASQVPQIVLLTFDDSVNDLNKDLYRDLFEKGRKNPNGCPISATFYVSHEWTDYSQVQNLAADGHEIASHSVSHSFGEQFGQKKWEKEINGQREILAAYGGVKLSEVRGMRAPFLAIGGNNMFKMLYDSNFTYDSSMPIYENKPPSWPYTLDHKIFHDCMIPPCPTKSYPGVWEVPMVMWQDLKGGRCSMGDACSNPPTAEGVYNMLAKNFERHYTTNRAPFGLYYHAAWFTQPHHKEGFEAFLDTLVNMDDVFILTNWQALQWVRNPTPLSQVLNFEPWSCHNKKDRPRRCNHPKVCNLWHKSGVRYMKTCQQCPSQYPWVGNTGIPVSNSL